METLADYFTIPEMMELFQIENREALIVKGGVDEKHGFNRVKFAGRLHLYPADMVKDRVEDKNTLETILTRAQAERGGWLVADWLPIHKVLQITGKSRQWFHVTKEGVRTITLDNTTLYSRQDIERMVDNTSK